LAVQVQEDILQVLPAQVKHQAAYQVQSILHATVAVSRLSSHSSAKVIVYHDVQELEVKIWKDPTGAHPQDNPLH
jgi:hypothetical protein